VVLGTLSSPVTLNAGTNYYIITAPIAFNDIYNSNTTVTTTAAASVVDSAYSSPPLDEGPGQGTRSFR
jgi:hypothetical protein